MTGEGDGRVTAPALVGMSVPIARTAGHEAGVLVVAADLDGAPLAYLTWLGVWIVTAQDPPAGSDPDKWGNVRISCERADGNEVGDREPRLPSPSPDELQAHATLDDG